MRDRLGRESLANTSGAGLFVLAYRLPFWPGRCGRDALRRRAKPLVPVNASEAERIGEIVVIPPQPPRKGDWETVEPVRADELGKRSLLGIYTGLWRWQNL